ncbi:NADH-quinone oxidoreductase subunit C, partial [Mycolicibacterium porcinum]
MSTANGNNTSTGQGPEVIGTRRGMFGASGTGDTSGYGRLVRSVALPGSSPRPYGGYFDEVVDQLAEILGEERYAVSIERVVVHRDELTLEVSRVQLPAVASILRDDPRLRFELCLGVSGVHYPDDTDRELHAVYPLMSITHNRRIRLEVAA